MSVAVMGVDPGVRGGLAVLRADGTPGFVRGFKPSMTEHELATLVQWAADILKMRGGSTCYMEKVGYIRGDGGQGAFTFGRVYGFLRGALRARDVDLKDVPPQLWQARMECLSGGDKNVTKRRAAEIYPSFKPMTHAVADALLIAAYGWTLEAANP